MHIIQETITRLLEQSPGGEPVTFNSLLPLVYQELREMAHRQLFKERSGHTLGTTALVNEAYLKLIDQTKISARGRAYFFSAVSRAMREILVDYARQRNRQKRGGKNRQTTFKTGQLQIEEFVDNIIDIDNALQKLEKLNPRHVRVVECRYFSGFTVDETATTLEISPRTVKQDWALAKAWLFRELDHDE